MADVATEFDWSYSAASRRINETQPAVVHVPFIQAPRVNATLHALYQGHFLRAPPPEADRKVCDTRSNWCRDNSWGLKDIMEQLERSTTIGKRLPNHPQTLFEAACSNNTWTHTKLRYCGFARDNLNASFWKDISKLRDEHGGALDMTGHSHTSRSIRISFVLATRRHLWDRVPYCFQLPSGMHTTWVAC